MLYTYRDIPNIKFPVYKLSSDNWHKANGIVYIDNVPVDDRNIESESLGVRRLQTEVSPLYKLRKGTKSIVEMLNFKHFIDNSGRLITYEKTKYQYLKHFLITKVEPKDTASLIWLHNISQPFISDRPPPPGARYARVLHFDGTPWLIYDFTSSNGKDTRRMI